MLLDRYAKIDAYTLEELKREYLACDSKGRIRLLKKLNNSDRLPFEIACLAVEDQATEVRQWIARHGRYLNYCANDEDSSDRNLENCLKNDPDPFVRACLRENPTISIGFDTEDWLREFRQATHLERLAIVRNPQVSQNLIEKIFDRTNHELSLNLKKREELIYAYLTNANRMRESQRDRYDYSFESSWDLFGWGFTRVHFSKLWKLISKWPKESKIQSAIYLYVGTDDETKAEIYQKCNQPVWRRAILMNCGKRDFRTIELGMKDADDGCRELAYEKFNPSRYTAEIMTGVVLQKDIREKIGASGFVQIPAFVNEKLQSVLQGEDKAALNGLAQNESLPVDFLVKVRNRLDDLDDEVGSRLAQQTIERVEKKRLSEEPMEQTNSAEKKVGLRFRIREGFRRVAVTIGGILALSGGLIAAFLAAGQPDWRWPHVTGLALLIGALSLLVGYAIIRLLGWIIEGFFSDR